MKTPILTNFRVMIVLAGLAMTIAACSSKQSPFPDEIDAAQSQEYGDSAEHSNAYGKTISLPAGKLSAAGVQVEPVSRGTLTHEHSVPGRVSYNDTRHIEVTAPTGGILTQVLVKPGDNVEAGQVLAWLNSPEIGTARADVLQRQADAELSATLANRAATLATNVIALTKALKGQPEFEAVRKQFGDSMLGDFREELFSAYSKLQFTESVLKSTAGLAKSGAVPGKIIEERRAAAQAARSVIEAACEQAALDVWKERSQTAAAARDAQRRVEIARQHLASLLSDAAIHADTDMPDMSSLGANDNDLEHLSRVAVRAPFAGTIERRSFSASERVRETDSMFVLADTSSLWVTAEIRENDWPAVSIRTGQSLIVNVPALGEVAAQAKVEFIGREVSPDTNAIPIVAVIDNSDERLRPGLFVRVSVPVGIKTDVLTVEAQSVLQHEGESFVFVADDENSFRRVNVVTGDDGEDRVEIVSGLKDGDQVVTHGAFILKSELLLEGEE